MKKMYAILIIFLVVFLDVTYCSEKTVTSSTEDLVNQLTDTSEIGYGYSALFSGSQFLCYPDTEQPHTLVFGSQPPTRSLILEKIVKQGIRAVPSLLKHIDDNRKTKIPPLKGMMWMEFRNDYDFNSRTRKEPPEGVNEQILEKEEPDNHTITVGDLCFVALGQILNRNFIATSYKPSAGLLVNSPCYSKQLCQVIRNDWKALTEEQHREMLIQDFSKPDYLYRLIGAYQRLAFYYPDSIEPLVLKQLNVPTFDYKEIDSFITKKLYSEKSKVKQKARFDDYVKKNGSAASDGILLQLFVDLKRQEADEQGRLHPPLKKKKDARGLLILLYGYPNDVKSDQVPYTEAWSTGDQGTFIGAIIYDRSEKVDQVVYEIFKKIKGDDHLALACMNRLIGRGYDDELIAYCKKRKGKNKWLADEFKQMLNRLEEKQPNKK